MERKDRSGESRRSSAQRTNGDENIWGVVGFYSITLRSVSVMHWSYYRLKCVPAPTAQIHILKP